MPITISGDGTITGISAGGLPDNSVQTADIADNQITTDKIADDQITLAKMAGGTDGQIITYDASGNPVAVGPGTDGQVLTSTGAGSPPAFEAAAAGGKVLQIVAANEQTVDHDYTIPNNQNAGSFGPITVQAGKTVTVGAGEVWTVV